MDRKTFFAALRRRESGVFGTSLSQVQVQGTEAILDSCIRNGVTNPHHVANILAQVYHETGGHMLGIKETVMPHHKDKNPSDQTVINRLEKAWRAGKLPWVNTPYWRDGAFGRGPIMITHWYMYEKMGKRLGVPLRQNPDLALDPKIGADIAVIGMSEGIFTGRKLSDYVFPEDLSAPPAHHPRRIVNGRDGTDDDIRRYHMAFHKALMEAGYSASQKPVSAQTPSPAPERQKEQERPSAEPDRGVRRITIGLGLGGLLMLAYSAWEWLSSLLCSYLNLFCGG